jgi:hypothetical protein
MTVSSWSVADTCDRSFLWVQFACRRDNVHRRPPKWYPLQRWFAGQQTTNLVTYHVFMSLDAHDGFKFWLVSYCVSIWIRRVCDVKGCIEKTCVCLRFTYVLALVRDLFRSPRQPLLWSFFLSTLLWSRALQNELLPLIHNKCWMI